MAVTNPTAAALADEQRAQLESWLVEFDRSWDEGRLASQVRALPGTGPLRTAALIEMVKIDLERNWQKGRKVSVESYLKEYPQLGTAATVPADLLQAECQARQRSGETGWLTALTERFPERAAELRHLVEQVGESAGMFSTANVASEPATINFPMTPTAPGTLPEQFGRYRIVRKLGQGGMGSVYLAHDSQIDRMVALKVPSAQSDSESLERFFREARAAGALRHPHICPVYDAGQIDGIHYLTMAFIEGQPLSSLPKSGPLEQRRAAALVRQLALALEVAHRHGVIHRDLKPANILLNAEGEPAITDFGLARCLNREDERLTQTGAILGTPAYMAPEQVEGRPEAMGAGCDIYSLGVILYELLTAKLPYRASNLTELLWKKTSQDAECPSVHRPDLDPALKRIILRAMSRKIEDRYGSMTEMAGALDDYLNAAPADEASRTTAALPAPARNALPSSTRKWIAVAAALVVLMALAGLWAKMGGRGGPKNEGAGSPSMKSPPVQKPRELTGDPIE